MAARARPRPSRFASQAALDSLLRYQPQRAALVQQIREAKENYKTTVAGARTTATETERSTQRAIPLLASIFGAAHTAEQPGVTLVSQQLAQPGVDPNLRAGAAQEVQTQIANIAKQGAASQAQMVERGTRAREGAQFAQTNAQQNLAKSLATLLEKGRSIAGEQGAFAASDEAKLTHEAEALDQRERANERSAGATERGQDLTRASAEEGNQTSRENAQEKARNAARNAAKHAPKYTAPGVKELSVEKHNSAREAIEGLRAEAFHIRQQHHTYDEAKRILEQPIKTKVLSRSGHPYSGKLKAALDLAYFGGLGKGTTGLLHKEGFSVGRLGYPLFIPTTHEAARVRGGV